MEGDEMLKMMLGSKLHRATVTESDLNYVGSITIDQALLEVSGMLPNEKVHIVNNNNGARFETYIIEGKRGSGEICVNGAAARLVQKGDTIIIMNYVYVSAEEAIRHEPTVVVVGKENEIEQIIQEKRQMTV